MLNFLATICGLIICLLIFYFDRFEMNKETMQYKLYKISHYVITMNLIISLTRIFITNYIPNDYFLLYVVTLFFHLTSTFLLGMFTIYCVSLIPRIRKNEKMYLVITCIPFFVIAFIILTSPITKAVYYIENGVIERGPLYIISFFTSILSFLIIYINTFIINKRRLSTSQKHNIILILIMPCTLLVIEFFNPNLVLSGFSFACNLLIIYNSFYTDIKDDFSGSFSKTSYITLVKSLFNKNKEFSIFFLKIENLNLLKSIMSIDNGKILFGQLNEKFATLNYNSECFYLDDNLYAFVSNTLNDKDIKKITQEIKKELDENLLNTNIQTINLNYCGFVAKCGKLFKTYEEILFLESYFGDEIIKNDFVIFNEESKNNLEKKKILIDNIIQLVDNFDLNTHLDDLDKIDTDLVQAYYQPILNNKTKKFLSAEVLMRLNFENLGGIIYPDKFIPYLEEKNFIHRFSCIILLKACKFIKELENQNIDIEGISVNFSLLEFIDKSFEEDILKIVTKTGVNPSKIHIEITETIQIEDSDYIRDKMYRLKEKGFKFYLDDFGTGYSNLSKLVDFPFDVVKFDKSLIDKSLNEEKTKELVNALITFMKKHNLNVLFEGIEDINGEILMKDFKVNFAQGYKYSRPIPTNDALIFFMQHQNTQKVIS